MYDAKAAVALPLLHGEQLVGVLAIESRNFATLKELALPGVPFVTKVSADRFGHTDFGRAVVKLAEYMAQSGALDAHTRAALPERWMAHIEQRITYAQDPNRHRSFYDQILQIATRIPGKAGLSGAILLLRRQQKTLQDSP